MSEKTITIEEVISKIDEIKPNAYTPEKKTEWLSKVDGMIQTEIMSVALADVVDYEYKVDSNKALLAAHPYYDLYEYYLEAMINYHNRDIAAYQNSMIMFNSVYKDYQNYMKNLNPSTSKYIKNIW